MTVVNRVSVRRAWDRRLWLGCAAGALLLAGFVRLAAETPPLLFCAALLPAGACAAAVVALDGGVHASRRLLAGAFLWGAVVAPVVAVALNVALRGWLGDTGSAWAAVLGAPLIEEAAKGAALIALVLVWPDEVDGVADGIVYGLLIGLGFTMAENLFYFAAAALVGGGAGLVESVYLRGALGGLTHAIFTAATGAGFGWARRRTGPLALAGALLGFAVAVAQHSAWNAVGAEWLDAAPCAPRAAMACPLSGRLWYWLLTAPAIVLSFLLPGMVAVVWLYRRRRSPGLSPVAARQSRSGW